MSKSKVKLPEIDPTANPLNIKELGLFGLLSKNVLTMLLGTVSPRTLGNLLQTTKAFHSFIKVDEVWALQIKRLKLKAKAERDKQGTGITRDLFESYDDKYLADDSITVKRDGDAIEGFFAGEISAAKTATKLEALQYEMSERGRRCPQCNQRTVHSDRGTILFLKCGKKKYMHRRCTQEFVTAQIAESLPTDTLNRPFALLAALRVYPSILSVEKYDSKGLFSEEEKKEEGGDGGDDDDADDWEAELESANAAEKEKEEAQQRAKEREKEVEQAFIDAANALEKIPFELNVNSSFAGGQDRVTKLQMRKRVGTKRGEAEGESDDGVRPLWLLVDEGLRTIAKNLILTLVEKLCKVTSLMGDKRYTVNDGMEENAKEIIKRIDTLWNTSLIPRSVQLESSPSPSPPRFTHSGQPIFPKDKN